MRSSGLVFSKENWDPLNTRVFSPDTKTGVLIAASTSVLSGLFKCSEPQKEVTPESLTAPCSSMSFPMYGWMVSNNLPFHPTAQCTMGTIAIYGFTSSKWSVLLDYTCRIAQCCETTSPLFRSLTNLRKVLLVSCHNLDVVWLHHGALGRALPKFLVDWGQPPKRVWCPFIPRALFFPYFWCVYFFWSAPRSGCYSLTPWNAPYESFWRMGTPLLPCVLLMLNQFWLDSFSL